MTVLRRKSLIENLVLIEILDNELRRFCFRIFVFFYVRMKKLTKKNLVDLMMMEVT